MLQKPSDSRQKCTLQTSDGHLYQGELIGAPLTSSGELVFTTGMVGYSEALTDPSYFGQILVFSYPLIGNYGIPAIPQSLSLPIPRGFESNRVHCSGVIVTIDSEETFHWNSFQSLDLWLKSQNIPGIVGLDTRHLVHEIRQNPGILGRIIPEKPDGTRNIGQFSIDPESYFDPSQFPVVQEVSTPKRVLLGKGKHRVAIIDCGVKWNIIRQLLEHECEVEMIPWNSDLSKIDCHGWLLSNGPGDPRQTGALHEKVSLLLNESRPILGICLGHQILALAAGARTKRMTYGHRSHNQPVYQVGTRRGYMTSQNHGYVVDESTLPDEWVPWFRNANDQTNEGIRHISKPFRSVQFHPEAAGGPRESGWIISDFVKEVICQ
jgi:carbamoyl-phosphate synthase small subunit